MARGIASYNDGLSREAVGRMQESAAITEAQLRAKAQQQALQQSYFQNQQASALQQQQLAQQAKYQQGQLANDRDRINASKDIAIGNRQHELDVLSKEIQGRIDAAKAATQWRADGMAADEDALAAQVDNLAETMTTRAKAGLKLTEIGSIGTAKTARGNEWTTRDSTAEKEFKPKLSGYFAGEPIDFGAMSWTDALSGATQRVGSQVAALDAIINANKDVASYVRPDPNDPTKFVSILKRRTAAPGTTTSTNAPAAPQPSFFPQPAAVVPPPQATGALDRTITVRTSDGRILKGPESSWPKLKAQDPGAKIVEAQPVPVPAAAVPAPAPMGGYFSQPAGSPLPTGLMQRFFQ